MLVFLFLLFTHVQSTSIDAQLQAALTNRTILWTPSTGWSDSSSYRGTLNILWSCLVTIFASIYTAIHLDIPLYRSSKWSRIAERIKWAVCCLIAPEIILSSILHQHLDARKLYRKLKESSMKTSKSEALLSSEPQDETKYNMSYAFWVAMGGFVVDTKTLHGDYHRVALTSSGVAFLAQHGYYIKLSEDQIADRSRANSLAKFLICCQVSWMLLQAFVRVGAGYPITLLEIHTGFQVACALLIYALCWNKPFDVEAPLVVDASNFKDILAYMIMVSLPIEKATWPDHIAKDRTRLIERLSMLPCNDVDGRRQKILTPLPMPASHYYNIGHAELDMLILDGNVLFADQLANQQKLESSVRAIQVVPKTNSTKGALMAQDGEKDLSYIESSATLSEEAEAGTIEAIFPCPAALLQQIPDTNPRFILDSDLTFEPSSTVLHRWRLCVQALIKLNLVNSTCQARYIRGTHLGNYLPDALLHGTTKPGSIILRVTAIVYRSRVGTYLSCFFTSIQGCFHLALWDFHFPTPTETLLWKIAALGLIATPIFLELLGPFWYFLDTVFPGLGITTSPFSSSSSNSHHRESFLHSYTNYIIHHPRACKHRSLATTPGADTMNHIEAGGIDHCYRPLSCAWEIQNSWMRAWTIISCFTIIFVQFCLALNNWYVVIESFISLRAVPLGAFSTTPWIQAIPHI